MSKARDLADFQGSASALTTGTLPVDRVPYVGRRNLIINGDFQIDQRGYSGTTTPTGNNYTVDRWTNYFTTTVTKGREVIGGKSRGTLNLNSTSYGDIAQRIEDYWAFSGQTVTVSFWIKATSNVTLDLMRGKSDASQPSIQFPVSTEWEYKTISYTAQEFTGSEQYAYVGIQAGFTGVNYTIAELQLELGSVATPFEHRSYGEELALCQRYYQKHHVYKRFSKSETVSHFEVNLNYPVTMRATPSIILDSGTYINTSGTSNGTSLAGFVPLDIGSTNFQKVDVINTGYGFISDFNLDAEL